MNLFMWNGNFFIIYTEKLDPQRSSKVSNGLVLLQEET